MCCVLEVWKPIAGYEGLYEVSEHGEVCSCERITSDGKHLQRRKLKGGYFSNEYKFMCLRKDGENKNHLVHRLVAQAFIPNPENKPCINHKDGNKQNNKVENLEWCTYSENRKHAYDNGLSPQRGFPRKVTIKQGEHIALFDTMKDCAKFFGFEKGWLHNQIRKHGCTFSYKDYEITVHERV